MRRLQWVYVLLSFIAFCGYAMTIHLGSSALNFQHFEEERRKRAVINEDGCGIIDDGRGILATPRYSAYNSADSNLYENVLKCLNQMQDTFATSGESYVDPSNFTMLRCDLNVTLELFQSYVRQYDTIWFFGDSVVQQQYTAFLCMLDPSLTHLQYNIKVPDTQSYEPEVYFDATYNNSLGGSTRLVFSRFGYSFDPAQHNLYTRAFPTVAPTLTANDAIVIGASAHYNSNHGSDMETALAFIANQSLYIKAPMFYMENAVEVWPTSNGLYTNRCAWFCTCEPLTSARRMGHGTLSTHDNNTILNDFGSLDLDANFFERLYPDMQFTDEDSTCIPDCIPPSWRMDIARAIFLNTTRNSVTNESNVAMVPNRVHYVPVWQQLAASGVTNSKKAVGDCTHKSLNGVIMINQQLLRTMINVKKA